LCTEDKIKKQTNKQTKNNNKEPVFILSATPILNTCFLPGPCDELVNITGKIPRPYKMHYWARETNKYNMVTTALHRKQRKT
jgi:hypothetical protein